MLTKMQKGHVPSIETQLGGGCLLAPKRWKTAWASIASSQEASGKLRRVKRNQKTSNSAPFVDERCRTEEWMLVEQKSTRVQ